MQLYIHDIKQSQKEIKILQFLKPNPMDSMNTPKAKWETFPYPGNNHRLQGSSEPKHSPVSEIPIDAKPRIDPTSYPSSSLRILDMGLPIDKHLR